MLTMMIRTGDLRRIWRTTLVVVKKRQFRTTAKQQSGRSRGSEVGAQIRVEKLTAEYVAQGASPDEARARARAELRATSREDWRV
jgi:hypothetical protein